MANPFLIAATPKNAAIAAANTSVSVSSTGSVTKGNLQIVSIEVSGATAPTGISPPDGTWTTLLSTTVTETSGLVSAAIFYKIATASGAFSGSFSWTTASTGGEWLFTEWAGFGAAIFDGAIQSVLTGVTTSPSSPAIAPGPGNVNDTYVGFLFGGALTSTTISGPSAGTSILNVAGSATQPLFGAAYLQLASGSTASALLWTLGTGQATLGVSLLLIQPAPWGYEAEGSAHSGKANVINPNSKRRLSATKGRSEFAVFASLPNMEWLAQPPQPPQPNRIRRAAAIMRGTDGNDAPQINFVGFGGQIQQPQPPRPRWERRGAGLRGDDGTQATKINFVSFGGEIQAWQPPPPYATRQSSFVKLAGTTGGDAGIEAPFIPPAPVAPINFEQTVSMLRQKTSMRYTAAKGRSDFAIYSTFVAWGWEVLPVQPNHPRPERSGALVRPDDGQLKTNVVVTIPLNWGFEPIFATPTAAFPKVSQRGIAASGDSQFAAFNMTPWAEIQGWQPKPIRKVWPAMFGDDGIEAKFVPPVTVTVWGFDVGQPVQRKSVRRLPDVPGNIDLPLVNFFPAGWEFQPAQPPRARWERRGAIARGDDGTVAQKINFFPFGWEVQAPQPPHPRPERAGAIMPIEQGIEGVFTFVALPIIWPYDVAPFQPPHPRRERFGALVRGEDGNEGTLINFLPFGFEVQAPQPGHPRPERAGSIMPSEPGIEGKFVPPVVVTWGYEPIQTTSRVKFERAGAIARGQDGTDAPFQNFRPSGWQQVESAQRARRRVSTEAVFNIEAKFVFVPPAAVAYVSNPDILLRRVLNPGAAIAPFEGGWYIRPFVNVFYATTTISFGYAKTVVKGETRGQ